MRRLDNRNSLFVVETSGREAETDDDHFLSLSDVLGLIPQDILAKWSDSAVYLVHMQKHEGDKEGVKRRVHGMLVLCFSATIQLVASPYDVDLWFKRKEAHDKLGYPELAMGDLYKYLLLHDDGFT